jgi:hypothetical protein
MFGRSKKYVAEDRKKMLTFCLLVFVKMQWKPVNVITLGHIKSDFIN